jgi:ubiquinone biosynthesis protein COQ9
VIPASEPAGASGAHSRGAPVKQAESDSPARNRGQCAAGTALETGGQSRYGFAMTEDLPLADLRPRLVAAMLPNVPFDGWTAVARDMAAEVEGIDRDIAAMALPDATAMVDAYTARADALMTEALSAAIAAVLPDRMKVRDRISFALNSRLDTADPDKEAVRRALAVLLMPTNAPLAASTLWRTADAMWRAAGDTSTDFNFYTKRTILGGVYSAVLLYWLDDDSDDHADTRAFIDRRIDGIMTFEKTKAQVKSTLGKLPDPARFLGRLRYPVS